MLFHNVIILFLMGKNDFWTKPISKSLTTSLKKLYCQAFSNKSESNQIFTIDIVVGGDHGQGKFRSVCKFILRNNNVKNLNSCVIKNAHIDCEKDTYDFLNESIVKRSNDKIKIIMNENMIKNLLSNIPEVKKQMKYFLQM